MYMIVDNISHWVKYANLPKHWKFVTILKIFLGAEMSSNLKFQKGRSVILYPL